MRASGVQISGNCHAGSDGETLLKIMRKAYPTARETALEPFAGLFLDLQLKAANGEISTKAVDLRGILAAVGTMKTGLSSGSRCADGRGKQML